MVKSNMDKLWVKVSYAGFFLIQIAGGFLSIKSTKQLGLYIFYPSLSFFTVKQALEKLILTKGNALNIYT